MTRGVGRSSHGSFAGIGPGGDDAVLEAVAGAALDLHGLAVEESTLADDVIDLARLGEPAEVAGQRLDDFLGVAANRVHVDLGGGELEADAGGVAGVGDDLGGVQQRLGGDAADVEAGAAEAGRGRR